MLMFLAFHMHVNISKKTFIININNIITII